MNYDEPKEGEAVYPIMAPDRYKMACCDCGLVHDIQFEVTETNHEDAHSADVWPFRVVMRVFRNNRSTGQVRRWMRAK